MIVRRWVCKSGCGECCGCVPVSRSSWKKYQARAVRIERVDEAGNLVLPITTDGKCCFLNDSRECAIYKDRPNICRIYGRSVKIPCPYIRPDGSARSYIETSVIKEYINLQVDAGIFQLKGVKHEALAR
jgi:Fe-S-cluster containining protein